MQRFTQGHTARQGQKGSNPGRTLFLFIDFPVKGEKCSGPFEAELRQSWDEELTGGWFQFKKEELSPYSDFPQHKGSSEQGPGCWLSRTSLRVVRQSPSVYHPALSSRQASSAPRASYLRPSLRLWAEEIKRIFCSWGGWAQAQGERDCWGLKGERTPFFIRNLGLGKAVWKSMVFEVPKIRIWVMARAAIFWLWHFSFMTCRKADNIDLQGWFEG